MIILYSGIPGSGKSYKMVSDLLSVKDKYYIVQNIEGLNLSLFPHVIDFRAYIQDNGLEFNDFFSKSYQENFTSQVREKYGLDVLVVIDESHEWFDKSYKTLKMWLSYHRHLNQTIWLVAHRSSNLSSGYRSFIEVEYRAKTSSLMFLPGYFLYNRISGGERVGYKLERKRSEVFAAYSSMVVSPKDKQKKSIIVPGLLFLMVIGLCYFFASPYLLYGRHVPSASSHLPKPPSPPPMSSNSSSLPMPPGGMSLKSSPFAGCRYVGNMAGIPLFENSDGRQIRLTQFEGDYMVIEASGSDYVRIYDLRAKLEYKVVNYGAKQRLPISEGGAVLPILGKVENKI